MKITVDIYKEKQRAFSLFLEYQGDESLNSLTIGTLDVEFLTFDVKTIREFWYYISTVPTFGAKKLLNIALLVPGVKMETCSLDGIKAALDLFPSQWSYKVDKDLPKQEYIVESGDPLIL